MERQRAVISIFLLALMVLINTAALHVFAHDHYQENDSTENCVVCDYAHELQTESFFLEQQPPFEISTEAACCSSQLNLKDQESSRLSIGTFFCRPPPFLS